MQTLYIYLILFLISVPGLLPAQHYQGVEETARYIPQATENELILTMDYASPVIKNPEAWSTIKGQKIVREVQLIFTQYPRKPEDWITNYDSLMESRKASIQKLIPEIAGRSVKWKYLIQTSCTSEKEAKKLFHGAVVRYSIQKSAKIPAKEIKVKKDTLVKPKVVYKELPLDFGIKDLVNGKFQFADSIVFKVFDRHPEWKDMLVINDWTGSMYEFGAQTVLWNKINLEKKAVRKFVFFNDGDRKKDYKKVAGKTGGIYFCNPDNLDDLIKTMNKVMENGYGGDMPENNIEAILAATEKTKSFGDVVMIADNRSPVRDLVLLNQVKVPIRVILCGSYKGGPILPDYLEIARKTGGSIHTIEEDILNLSAIKEGAKIVMLNTPYIFENGRFEKLNLPLTHENQFE